ncbi:MAG: hypothetical protein P0Y48_04975 [Candidatus Microbacterium phytovorans]|uniref:Uncharacterized protein n=1 Tax=Candidatus Microbacterium phytovorans TaxID=3121374 RepID=A0AAJ5W2E5_9MICO|nr:hypothetical protein [Microbacterium sp.]WEK14559.1 MAG: hypothetical protein P0Y48_04975 [Microbacterium sp.]
MTATVSRAAQPLATLPRPDRWHRPLLALAAGMLMLSVVCGILAIVDPRLILGQNAWFKPLKFSLSIAVYAVTLAWLIGQVHRWRRAASIAGTIVVIALVAEMVIIVGAAAAGTTSHFNVSTPLNTTLWSVMAASIVIVWIVTLLVGIALVVSPTPDAARNLAIRGGVALGLVGMAVAFLMTGPTPGQLDDFQGIAGAHAVGVADGGAGLPFLGWSTEGGDLRVPHFVGMHALQILPLSLLALELLSRRMPALRDGGVRWRLVMLLTVAYAAMIGILTWQALIGQSVVAPAGPVLAAGIGVAVATVAACAAVVVGARR